eukprot:6175146-Amphidinium_carterae.2
MGAYLEAKQGYAPQAHLSRVGWWHGGVAMMYAAEQQVGAWQAARVMHRFHREPRPRGCQPNGPKAGNLGQWLDAASGA